MPTFIDCEASSLNQDSYPIEIAWNGHDGIIESHIINPYLYPKNFRDWSPEAQSIHGLSRKYLCENGVHPGQVVAKMKEALDGKNIFSDAPDFEGFWIGRLFESQNEKVNFKINNAMEVFHNLDSNYKGYFKEARKKAGGIHRASYDVKYLMEIFHMCKT